MTGYHVESVGLYAPNHTHVIVRARLLIGCSLRNKSVKKVSSSGGPFPVIQECCMLVRHLLDAVWRLVAVPRLNYCGQTPRRGAYSITVLATVQPVQCENWFEAAGLMPSDSRRLYFMGPDAGIMTVGHGHHTARRICIQLKNLVSYITIYYNTKSHRPLFRCRPILWLTDSHLHHLRNNLHAWSSWPY